MRPSRFPCGRRRRRCQRSPGIRRHLVKSCRIHPPRPLQRRHPPRPSPAPADPATTRCGPAAASSSSSDGRHGTSGAGRGSCTGRLAVGRTGCARCLRRPPPRARSSPSPWSRRRLRLCWRRRCPATPRLPPARLRCSGSGRSGTPTRNGRDERVPTPSGGTRAERSGARPGPPRAAILARTANRSHDDRRRARGRPRCGRPLRVAGLPGPPGRVFPAGVICVVPPADR